jgi:hypothetical protein
MAVRYVRVTSDGDPFSPAVRPTGNVAVVGAAPIGTADVPVQVATPTEAATAFGSPDTPGNSVLTRALVALFRQTPGANQVWGVRTGADVATALIEVEKLDVQFVVVAGITLDATTGGTTGPIGKLLSHVTSVSNTADGKERMGVVMLAKNATDPTVVKDTLVSDRMVYVAHRSDDDVAAAVAGAIAGRDPSVSMVLKPVSVASDPFTSANIDAINGSEGPSSPPAGKGVNWLVDPPLIPGGGVFLGEGYTGNPGGKKYIDVLRTVDDVSFRLKARLMQAIGTLRISRSGLRGLLVQIEAVLNPLVSADVIEGYVITIPVLRLLDADPATLSAAQLQQINDAQVQRLAEVLISIDYAGAIHRISITLTFA